MLFGLALLIASVPQDSSATSVRRGQNQCVITGEDKFGDLRPTAIVSCGFSDTELEHRLLSLFRHPEILLSIEAVESAFSLPKLVTSFDAPRQTSYNIQMKGANERWHVILTFSESFYPTGASQRPRFLGSGRPALINGHRRGEIRLDLTWLSRDPEEVDDSSCLNIQRIRSDARRYGWRSRRVLMTPYDGPSSSTTTFYRGRFYAGGQFDEKGCASGVTFIRSADPRAKLEKSRP